MSAAKARGNRSRLAAVRTWTAYWNAALVAVAGVAVPLAAQQAPVAGGGGEEEHRIRRGDTLWDLSRHYLGDPFLWPAIHDVNRDRVENPHLIYPDHRLRIPGHEADRMAVAPSGAPAAAPGERTGSVALAAESAAGSASGAPALARTRFYGASGIRVETAPRTVDGQPEGSIRVSRQEHHAAPWLAEAGTLPVVGRFVRAVDPATEDLRWAGSARRFEEVYLEYTGTGRPRPGDRLLLVDVGRRIDTRHVIRPAAAATVVSSDPAGMRVRLTEQFGRARAGSLALPLEPFEAVRGKAVPVDGGPVGQVLAFAEEQALYGPAAIAFVSLGSAQGLAVGDDLVAYLPARSVGRGPAAVFTAEPVATLRVVRTTTDVATVRVLNVMHPALEPGLPVALARKVP